MKIQLSRIMLAAAFCISAPGAALAFDNVSTRFDSVSSLDTYFDIVPVKGQPAGTKYDQYFRITGSGGVVFNNNANKLPSREAVDIEFNLPVRAGTGDDPYGGLSVARICYEYVRTMMEAPDDYILTISVASGSPNMGTEEFVETPGSRLSRIKTRPATVEQTSCRLEVAGAGIEASTATSAETERASTTEPPPPARASLPSVGQPKR